MHSDSLIFIKNKKVLGQTFFTLMLTIVTTVLAMLASLQYIDVILANSIAVTIVGFITAIVLLFAITMNRDNGFGLLSLFMLTGVIGVMLTSGIHAVLETSTGVNALILALVGTIGITTMMTIIALSPNVDTKGWGQILFAVLIGLVVIEFVNAFFLHLPMLMVLSSIVGAVLFSFYIIHDVNSIVHGRETNYIMATTSMYLNVLNLFTDLLNIFEFLSGD
jgi:FtsH-binding integral membrane protein